MQRAFFPKDNTLFDIMKSDEFKKLLATDASTLEGQDFIKEIMPLQYYGLGTLGRGRWAVAGMVTHGAHAYSRY